MSVYENKEKYVKYRKKEFLFADFSFISSLFILVPGTHLRIARVAFVVMY